MQIGHLGQQQPRFHMVSAPTSSHLAGLSSALVRLEAAAPRPAAKDTRSLQLVCIKWRTEHQVHVLQLPSAGIISVQRATHEPMIWE